MLIDCPGCARSYHVGDADLGERGRTVVCPRCDTQWYQHAPGRDLSVAAVSTRPSAGLDEAPAAARRFRLPRFTLGLAGVAIGCLILAALVDGRDAVVRALPRTSALYAMAGLPVNVVGLTVARVVPQRLASNDVTVRGALRNVVGRRVEVPRLAFEVRDAAGTTLVAWSETAATRTVGAGKEVDFVSTPHRLPAESRSVLVHFE